MSAMQVTRRVVAALLLAVVLAGCRNPVATETAPANRDPRIGWVALWGGVEKRCDGSTLIYTLTIGGGAGGGMSVVPGSTECQP